MYQSDRISALNIDGFTYIKPENWEERLAFLRELILTSSGLDPNLALENLHTEITLNEVNEKRLKMISVLNADKEKLEWLLEPLSPFILEILGPDCLRQKKANLIIHQPQDRYSIIPEHSDVLTGNSSFEINCWIPLTKCLATNTMYLHKYGSEEKVLLSPERNEVAIFKHFLRHGNFLNTSNKTRVSLNIRFKSLFSPENKKSLIDYYELWKVSDFTKIAMQEWLNES